jgi:error-prone DNA polymerase
MAAPGPLRPARPHPGAGWAGRSSPAPAPSGGVPVPGQPAIRPGLSTVRNLGDAPAAAIEAGQPYTDLADFARRTSLPVPAMEALAIVGHNVIRRAGRPPPRLTPT